MFAKGLGPDFIDPFAQHNHDSDERTLADDFQALATGDDIKRVTGPRATWTGNKSSTSTGQAPLQ